MHDKLLTAVRGDMGGKSVFGEDMDKEKSCQAFGSDVDVARNKNPLLRCAVYDGKDRIKAIRLR